MKCFYYDAAPNVGDEVNCYLWSRLLGRSAESEDGRVGLLGIGTLLSEEFCQRLDSCERIVVFGAGAGYGRLPRLDARWDVRCVRGIQTARAVGVDERLAVADAAYLLGSLTWARRSVGPIVVIPHHASMAYLDWNSVCQRAGFSFLSPTLPGEDFFDTLSTASLVLTEAMHGAIFADIARIPWVPFRFGPNFLERKWTDWADMFNLSPSIPQAESFYDPQYHNQEKSSAFHAERRLKALLGRRGIGRRRWRKVLPPGDTSGAAGDRFAGFLQGLAQREGYLSADSVFDVRVSALHEKLSHMADEYGLEYTGFSGSISDLFDQSGRR